MGRRRWGPGNCALGTSNDIFFYVGPFRYPSTACGILFSHSIESDHVDTAKATPFDSGGLVHRLGRPDADESVSTYLARRELPPDHRQYLSYTLTRSSTAQRTTLKGRIPCTRAHSDSPAAMRAPGLTRFGCRGGSCCGGTGTCKPFFSKRRAPTIQTWRPCSPGVRGTGLTSSISQVSSQMSSQMSVTAVSPCSSGAAGDI